MRCFKCVKDGQLAAKSFEKQTHANKHAMKVEVTTSDSTISDNMDNTNFMEFIASNSVVDPQTTT